MNNKALIKQHIIPAFERKDMMCVQLDSNIVEFRDVTDSVSITYDFISVPALTRIMVGKTARQKELRIILGIKANGYWTMLRPDRLIEQPTTAHFFFDSKEVFEKEISNLNNEVFSSILPTLLRINRFSTPLISEYYHAIADQPQKKAVEFAQKNHCELVCTPSVQIWAENWIRSRIPAEEKRAAVFCQNADELLAFAAFFGELIRLKTGGRWSWVSVPEKNSKIYGVEILDESGVYDDGYDVIDLLLRFWNYSSDFKWQLFPN